LSVAVVCGALVISAFLASGCGSGGGATSASKKTAADVGVPVYPGTSPEEAYSGVYRMVTTDSFEKVVTFYKDKLPAAVYSEIAIPTGKGASLVVDDGGFHGNLSVEENLPSPGKVTVTASRFK
jgi:hypothetical protein